MYMISYGKFYMDNEKIKKKEISRKQSLNNRLFLRSRQGATHLCYF